MLTASFALLTLPACDECDSSIDPVKCTDLCTQSPPNANCAQCQGDSLASDCPQCQGDDQPRGCPLGGSGGDGGSAGTVSGSGGSGGTGATSGVGGSGGTGGVVGGEGGMSGGLGGTAAIDAGPPPSCEQDQDCTEASHPRCSEEGECAPCMTSAVCLAHHESRALCDTQGELAGTCVECESSDDCIAASTRSKCLEGMCTECAIHTDCDDPDHPECSPEGVCVECTGDGACDERGNQEHCDVGATSLTRGQCLECLEHAHCDNPEPQCNAGECGACTINDDACASRVDGDGVAIQQCNTRLGLETSGQCVRCTADNETDSVVAGGCGNNSCNRDLGVCTDTMRGSLLVPCEPCVADSECGEDLRCVRHSLEDQSNPGSYCFYDRSADGVATCASVLKPFTTSVAGTSIDGVSGNFCMLLTSCEAFQDANEVTPCVNEDECGLEDPDVDGALCIGLEGMKRCSYTCSNAADNECPNAQPDCNAGRCRP